MHPAGVLIPDVPYQSEPDTSKKWTKDGYVFTPLAYFEMDGRVVRSKRYYFGSESELSPIDLVMAWGPLSNTEVLEKNIF